MEGGDGSTTVVVVVDDVEVIVGHLVGQRPRLAVVDALARLQLAALRVGCTIRVRDPSTALRELLDLVGLADLVADTPGHDEPDPGPGAAT